MAEMSSVPSPIQPLLETAYQLTLRPAESGEWGRYAKLAAKLRVITDHAIEQLEALAGPVACQAGCNACCHRLVVANVPEVAAIVALVSEWEAPRRDALFERVETYEADGLEEWRHRAPCPFLEEGLCSIYDARPLSCRSLSSQDAAACAAYLAGEDVAIPVRPMQQELVGAVDEGMVEALRASNRVFAPFDMPSAVRRWIQHPDEAVCLLDGERHARINRYELDSEVELERIPRGDFLEETLQSVRYGWFREALLKNHYEEARNYLRKMEDNPVGLISQISLPPIFASQDELEAAWLEVGYALDRLEAAKFDPFQGFQAVGVAQPFRLAYAGKDVKAYFERFMGHCHHQFAEKCLPQLCEPMSDARKAGPIRVGFLSYRLDHSNGCRWALGWAQNLGPEFETYALHVAPSEDLLCVPWRRSCDTYHRLPFRIEESATLIRSLDLDALIFTDPASAPTTVQLSLLRLARRQYAAWGSPFTSGSPTIDGYLSSELMEPEGAEAHYSERLIRLPNSGLCLPPLFLDRSDKVRADFGLPESAFVLCTQDLSKLTPHHDEFLRQIAEQAGKPLLFLLNPPLGVDFDVFEERLKRAGIHSLLLPSQSRRDFLRLLELADFVVETPTWSGGSATIEALSLGTAVITLPGEFMRGRQSLAFLKLAGVGALAAHDEREFLELASNPSRREDALKNLQAGALIGDKAPIDALAALLRESG